MPDDFLDDDDEDFDGFGQPEREDVVEKDFEQGAKTLELSGLGGASWGAATNIVRKVRPVPWLLWSIIRSVYGKSGELGDPLATAFSPVSNLICRAAQDRTLSNARPEASKEDTANSLTEAVQLLGSDVAASLCFLHAVCRRVGSLLAERVWRPIVDDALLRAHLGYHVGELSGNFGAGRGMLVGFSGRCGLAIQIASGDMGQAQKALSGLASGVEIGEICLEVYGCDPLQVAALSLIAGGCNRDIALGIAAYSRQDEAEVIPGSEQHRWLQMFEVLEHLRMNRNELITQSTWNSLGFDPAGINELNTRVQLVQRKGHGWRWITQSLGPDPEGPPKKLK